MQSRAPERTIMNTIKKICETCKKEFDAPLTEHNRGHARFCSLSCAYNRVFPIKEPNVTCAYCGKYFYKNKSKQKSSKSGLFFCCRKCKDNAQKMGGIREIMPPHYGSSLKAYRTKALRHMGQKCNRCGYAKNIHALIVHHKNRDRTNNDLSNLEILCANCHFIEHFSKN